MLQRVNTLKVLAGVGVLLMTSRSVSFSVQTVHTGGNIDITQNLFGYLPLSTYVLCTVSTYLGMHLGGQVQQAPTYLRSNKDYGFKIYLLLQMQPSMTI